MFVVNNMNDELLVGMNEYKVLNEKNPIGYTRDIQCCIAILIHRKKSTTLLHVESYSNSIVIDNLIECLKRQDDNKILSVDIFKGPYTDMGNLSIVLFLIHRLNLKYNIYDIFKNNSNETSVGYNFNTKDYYMVRMNKGKPMLRSKKINGNE